MAKAGAGIIVLKAWLVVGAAIAVLVGVRVYFAFPHPHPTHNQSRLKAIAAEARQLIATYPVSAANPYIEVPKTKWPPEIASLTPYAVSVRRGMVEIDTEPWFDGGWGYGFALDKRDLTMLVECWSDLGQGMYWHGPC